ncbi:MAG: sigma-70 family RNA polymerase sigma factor, partial [Bacilli bacterium]
MQHELMVHAAKNGDDDAFYRLILDNKEKMYRIAYSYFKNETDALEAIQEVTYRAYVRIKKLREPQYFNTWLIRIMINYCLDEMKKGNRFVQGEVNLENSDQLQTSGQI